MMLSDYEITRQNGIRPIRDIAEKLGVDDEDLMPYGGEIAKVNLRALTRPRDFQVTVRNIQVSAGAGFLIILTGNIMRMPGLPKRPMAEQVELLPDGTVIGVG